MSTKLRVITRRQVLAGSAVSAAALASGFPAPAIANSDPIKIGFLPALTGPSSSTGVGINRGTELAVAQINDAGGINGRKIELIVRDTQSDPTKAVNAVAELTQAGAGWAALLAECAGLVLGYGGARVADVTRGCEILAQILAST